MSKLFIAEKPELAKAIATGMNGNILRKDGYFQVGDNIVTWAYGHILSLAMPELYDEKYKAWRIEDLPLQIDINNFKYVPLASSKKQLKVITDLIKDKTVTTIVNCGDADEEGQILVDEILNYSKNKKPVERLLVNDLTEKGVKTALSNIKSNTEFKGLSDRGFARSQADYLLGLNLTRAYTKLAQNNGYDGVLSVGRVQTPILGLIVARDNEHESHKSSFYYTIKGLFNIDNLEIKALLKREDKIVHEEDVKRVELSCKNKTGVVQKATNENKKENAPLPYSLLILQAECSKKFGYKPDKTLEITQGLREKHKLITYNRSDCSYLPENLFEVAPATLESIKANLGNEFNSYVDNADKTIKSKAWNDNNVTAHHGIIPTEQKVDIKNLSKDELNVYQLIAKRFVAQFYENKEFILSTVEININDNIFITSSRKIIKQGFEVLFKSEDLKDDDTESEDFNDVDLANIKDSSSAYCKDLNIEKKKTAPKPYYTIPTLLKDLTSVAKYVSNEKIKKLLLLKDENKKGENGGIGTPATRSEHIKNLFEKGYIIEEKKAIKSTQKGRDLIALSPKILTTPDMTALWFELQKEIETGKITKEQFLTSINKQIEEEINRIKNSDKFQSLTKNDNNSISCPQCNLGFLKRMKSVKEKKVTYWWGCSNYSNGCKAFYFDKDEKPQFEKIEKKVEEVSEHKCPTCENGDLIRRKTDKGLFWWGCSNYKDGCKTMFYDKDGKPDIK